MALTPTVLTDAYIVINSNVVSDHGNKVKITYKAEGKDITAFGAVAKSRTGGLKDGSIALTFFNDFAASNLDSIMWALIGSVVTFEIRPTSGSVSTSNPKYTGSIFIEEWSPVDAGVGDLVEVSVTFPTSGAITRATS